MIKLTVAAFWSIAAAVGQTYEIQDIGLLPGQPSAFATGINNKGDIVGMTRIAGTPGNRAFLYKSKSCTLIDLGTFGGNESFAQQINDGGVITGAARRPDGQLRAFSYSGGTLHDLGGALDETGQAINRSGDVVGIESLSGLGITGVHYSGGASVPLPTVNTIVSKGSVVPIPVAINDPQQVAGFIRTGSSFIGVVSNSNFGAWNQIQGVPELEPSIRPFAMNNNGFVVGATGRSATPRAFLSKNPNEPAIDLGTLGGDFSAAEGINQHGWVVGWAERAPGGGPAAFLYNGTDMVDLQSHLVNGAEWVLKEAIAINDSGEIVGNGIHKGQPRAFLLIPR